MNKLVNYYFLNLFYTLFLLGSAELSAKEIQKTNLGILSDRIIFEVNKQTFTQRQMEIYLYVKQFVQNQASDIVIINKENWSRLLEQYKEDMLIYHEIKRLGRFQAEQKNNSELLKLFKETFNKSSKLKKLSKNLNFNDGVLRSAILDAVQVNEYRSLKGGFKGNKWLSALKEKYVVRVFLGSDLYLPIKSL